MKQLKLSFLFFYFGVLSFLFFKPNTIFAQTKIDSTQLYYNTIWYPQKSKASINSAVLYFENLSDKFLTIHDTINAVNCLRSVTEGYYKIGAIFESELFAVKGFKLLDNIELDSLSKNARTRLSNHLGRLYREISDYDSAIKYFNHSLDLSETSIDSISIMTNLANIYTDQKKYIFATNILNLVNKKIEQLDDYKRKWTVIDNLGYNQSKLNIPGALDKMKLALNMRLAEQDPEGTFSSYRHLTYYYLDRNNKTTAKLYAKSAKEIADALNSPTFKYEALRLNALISEDYKIRELIKLSDSITKTRQLSDNKYANKKYNNEKLIKENANKQLILLDERNKKNTYLALVSLAVLGIIFLFFYDKQQHKIGRIEERHITETTISKKIHDELGNDIFYLMAQIQSNPKALLDNKGVKVLNGLNTIYGKARDISRTYTKIETGDTFGDELTALLNSYGSNDTKIVTTKIDPLFWKSVSNTKKVELYRILQELLTNMKKHSQASFAAVTFTKKQNKVFVNYADNGIGMSKENLKLNNGLSNVESRINAMNGNITFDTKPNEGFKVEIRFTA